jgi:uncharacterized protein (TIGR01244 family)
MIAEKQIQRTVNLSESSKLGKLYQMDHIFLSSGPGRDDFKEIKDLGVKTIIDLKKPEENHFNEAEKASEFGLEYINVPIAQCTSFNDQTMEIVEEVLSTSNFGEVLIYCRSCNRAATWAVIKLVKEEGWEIDSAISFARTVGLDNENATKNVRSFLANS